MLTLPIKKKWFDMIRSGEKKEEYREIKPYYDSRFKSYIPDIGNIKIIRMNCGTGFIKVDDEIIFRNGYSSNSPSIKCRVEITKGYGKEEWGAEPNKEYYVLKILDKGENDGTNNNN